MRKYRCRCLMKAQYKEMETTMTRVIAHRGASAYAPENTLAAFILAVEQEANMVELDVQRTADGALVVFHDATTQRWNGQPRPVAECSLTDLRTLDIGGERIALLAEVCALARERGIGMNVEIKAAGIGAEVARLLHEEKVTDRTLISSFLPDALGEIARADSRLPRGVLMGARACPADAPEDWPIPALREAGAAAWHPPHQMPLLAQLLPRVRAAGFQVNVWTVNDPALMRELALLGADGIITDKPDVLRGVLDEITREE